MNSRSQPAQVVRRYFSVWAVQDRATAERVVSDDFHFTSPLDNRLSRATFFERCWPNSASIAAFDLKRVVPDGDLVFVMYELTMKDGRRFRNTEALTVRDGQVCEAEVYFGWDLPHKAAPGGFIDKQVD
jgi:ketosteroid isomerase-like protein